jgi:hypothetical protein
MRNVYRSFYLIALLITSLIFLGFRFANRKTEDWRVLFNGKDLVGWDTYLGPASDSAGHKMNIPPTGLNKDPKHVFSIVSDPDGGNVIRVSGEDFGAITSKEEFENYHLQLKFKWGLINWPAKRGKKKDSGILYHSVGADGADYGYWKRSQEFQVEEGNCGDYWGVAGGFADVPSDKINDSLYVYNPQAKMYTFRAQTPVGRYCAKKGDAENATGEWNVLDLYCSGDTSIHVVNGKVMMVLYHSRQWDDGQASPLVKGKVQIQSEGAEVFYKDIRIQPVKNLNGILPRNTN